MRVGAIHSRVPANAVTALMLRVGGMDLFKAIIFTEWALRQRVFAVDLCT